ncbi:MAG: hypothetical protein OEZ01_07515 [Candidatus Heimdallarchaeota archaeon]|nr:hypothetical protein [Candidatus Heimdallarchaeota archaeon]MDH5645839.1 hypothetical protein [Candidatus Heimdallarchaeota archaeon]
MDLKEIDQENQHKIIQNTLRTQISEDEITEIIEGLLMEIEAGSILYSIEEGNEKIGFIIATPLSENEDPNNIDYLSIDEIWIKTEYENSKIPNELSVNLKKLAKKYKTNKIEIIVSQNVVWLGNALLENGYICYEVKLEKLLPKANNLTDVLELIQESTPADRIVQVLLEKDDNFQTEFVEEADELIDQISEGWLPVMVVVIFEPENQSFMEIIEYSNKMINWDDYSIIYRL